MERVVDELKKDGKTLLITSHILPEAEKMCDSVALIKAGHLVASGSLADIKKKYSEPAVIVRLQDAGSMGRAVELLKASFTGSIESSDGTLVIHASELDRTTPLINRKLMDANIPILEIKRQESSLDDVYFKAMGE